MENYNRQEKPSQNGDSNYPVQVPANNQQQTQNNGYSNQNNGCNQSNGNTQQSFMYKPDSNLVWAILTTIFCCLPFGIVSIVYAAKVDSLWSQGQQQEAYEAASKAKTWAIWSAISCLIIAGLELLFYFVLGLGIGILGL